MKTKYVLITPVYNEKELIEGVIKSVIAQTIPPQKWIIVDDGSTDETAEIIRHYEAQYGFIMYLQLQRDAVRTYYARRAKVAMSGYEKIKSTAFEFVGCLDADISIEPTYFQRILEEFDRNPRLGIASGVYINKVNGRFQKVIRSRISTVGALQFFRRQCYEEIGGYMPLKYGGDDSLADIMARMNGWETRSFPLYQVIHHRPSGTRGGRHILEARFRQGLAEYHLGTHPLFMLVKSLRRALFEKPYFFGSVARLLGFSGGYLTEGKREISDAAMSFVREEQIRRLFNWPKREQDEQSVATEK